MVPNIYLDVIKTEVEIKYVRSSGPGGQNVNKVNTKAVLRFNPGLSNAYSAHTKSLILEKLQSRLTGEGELVIMSDRFRDQAKNREDCFEKLEQILRTAAHRDRERRDTKPTRSSKRRRLDGKAKHGDKKAGRKKIDY